MIKVLFASLTFLLSCGSWARVPESWDKEDGYEVQRSGVLKTKKRVFNYKVGAMSAGKSRYDIAIRLSWIKDSELAYDAEVSGFISDSPDGKLSMIGNSLVFTGRNFESQDKDGWGRGKMRNFNFCWTLDEESDVFVTDEDCDRLHKHKRKK